MENKRTSNAPIAMAEDYWANTHFSVARYYGGIKAFGYEYQIVNKEGITIFELSDPTSRHYVGDGNKAIEPDEPADLVQVGWIPVYKVLKRKAFLEYLKTKPTLEQALNHIKVKKGGQA